VTYTVTASFNNNASGTYTFSVNGAAGNVNGQAVQFSNMPVSGTTVTVTHATETPTPSSTPQPAAKAVVYPNPSNGGPVSVMAAVYSGTANVKVQVFTTAFRKVQEKLYTLQPYGPIQILMQDDWGNPLASGLYYVVISVNGNQRSVTKLLLLR